MKIVIAGILGIVLLFLAFQIYSFSHKAGMIDLDRTALEAQIQAAEKDRAALQAEEQYSKQEENLEKELRARFNYRAPGEKMIIIVPPASPSQGGPKTSSSASSSQ